MRKYAFIIIMTCLCCQAKDRKTTALTYSNYLLKTDARRKALAHSYMTADLTEERSVLSNTGKYLKDQLVNNIFPSWYGTRWTYSGHSDVPGKGSIACGYFISTPLKHAGFKLNRYKVAQKYSHAIIKTLCDIKRIRTFRSIEALKKYLRSQPDDLYIVGLDFHVGWIEKSGDRLYFIHSNYTDDVCVMKESLDSSRALAQSKVFVLGHFASNYDIIRKWLLQERIEIVL